jgi:hypothetical protein
VPQAKEDRNPGEDVESGRSASTAKSEIIGSTLRAAHSSYMATTGEGWCHGRMARGGYGLPKVPPAMPYRFTPCGRATPETAFHSGASIAIRDFVRWAVGWSVGPLVRWSVGPHITLNIIFSAVCGQIDLKFGRDLLGDLLFQFLLFFFLSFSSNSSFSPFSSFSSEIKLIYN